MSPSAIRWGGFTGSVALAVAAYMGGAGYTRMPSVNPVTLLRGEKGVLLPVCWLLGIALLLVAWWAGRAAVPSTRWALVTVGLWAVPVLPVIPLGSADVYAYACQGYAQFSGGDPYRGDVQGCPWLASMDQVWRHSPAPYGPLFLLVAAAAVGIALAAAGSSPAGDFSLAGGSSLASVIGGLRVIALVGLALAAVALTVLARRSGRDAGRAVWTVLACPLVLVHLVSGAHNDALMAGLTLAGLAVVARAPRAWSSRAWSWPFSPLSSLLAGGALLGLAVAVKATAIVVLPFAVLLFDSRASWRALLRPGLAIGAGAAASLVAMSLAAGGGLGWVAGLTRSGDTVAWTSPPTAVGLAVDWVAGLFGAHVDAVPITRSLGVAVLVVVLCVLWWRTRGGDALTGAGLALATTVLCAPVFQPWYAVWPLAVLGASRFADSAAFTRWVLIPCTVATTMALPAGYNWALYTRVPGSLLMTAAVIATAVFAVRRLTHPADR